MAPLTPWPQLPQIGPGIAASWTALAKSLGQAKLEITKCVVRCANCHAIRHFEEGLAERTVSAALIPILVRP